MKRILAIGASALLGASMLASPALSQVGAEIDAGTTAAIESPANMDRAVLAIGATAASAVAISAVSEVSTIQIVPIATLDGNPADLDQALTSSEAELPELHSAIQGNAIVLNELEAQGVDLNDVVAAQVEADGSLTVYVR